MGVMFESFHPAGTLPGEFFWGGPTLDLEFLKVRSKVMPCQDKSNRIIKITILKGSKQELDILATIFHRFEHFF